MMTGLTSLMKGMIGNLNKRSSMKNIYELQEAAERLRRVTEVNSIGPEEAFGLQCDILEYLADMEQNSEGLGIRKVYVSYAAMVADASAPVGINGKLLRQGQLVIIYDPENVIQPGSGDVYAWQRKRTGADAWRLMGNMGNVYNLKMQIDAVGALLESERARAVDAEQELDDKICAEETRAKAAERQNASGISAIEALVPVQASAGNQLADKDFVNSSIATNTANYISDNGHPFSSLAQLEAYSGTLTNNDYAFVVGTDSAGNTTYTRYKYNADSQEWAEEYVLNNSSFTAAQWAAINSSITNNDVNKLRLLPTKAQFDTLFAQKQDTLTSGTNIKTINNKSILGAGNLDVKDLFLVLYGATQFSAIVEAYIQGKFLYSMNPNGKVYLLESITDDSATFWNVDNEGMSLSVFSVNSDNVYSEIVQTQLQTKLVFDPKPIYGSTKAITSGAVYAAIDETKPLTVIAGISPTGVPSVDKTADEIDTAYQNGKQIRVRFTHATLGISFEDDMTKFTEAGIIKFVAHTIANGTHYIVKIYDEGGTTQLGFETLDDNKIIDLTDGVHNSGYYENLMRRVGVLSTDTPQIFIYTAYDSNSIASTAICISSCANTASPTSNAVFRQRLMLGPSEYVRTLSNIVEDGHYQIVQNWTLQSYMPLAGGAMTGNINMADHELQVRANRNGIKYVDASTGVLVGNGNMNMTIQSGNADLKHRKGTVNYAILDRSNTKTINGQDVYGTGNIPILQKSDMEALCAALQSAGIIGGYSVAQDSNGAYSFSFTAP